MGFGFRKSIKLGKGMRINLSKSGIGMSAGVKGFRVGMNSRGTYTSGSIPGTGIYHRSYHGTKSGGSSYNPGNPSSMGCGASLVMFWIFLVFIFLIAMPPFGILLAGLTGYGYWKYTKSPNYLNEKTKALIKKGDIEGAKQKLEEIEFPNSETNLLKALVTYAESNYSEAIDLFRKLKAEEKIAFTAFQYPYIDCLMKSGETLEAIKILQACVNDGVNDNRDINLLAKCFAQVGKVELAIETLKKAPTRKKQINEDLLESLYLLGIYYLDLGNTKQAKRFLQKVYAEDATY